MLVAGRAIVADRTRWVRGHMAIAFTPNGVTYPTQPHHPKAECFCAAGAAERAGHDLGLSSAERHLAHHPVYYATMLLNRAANEMGFANIVFLNDRDQVAALNPPDAEIHADVLRAYPSHRARRPGPRRRGVDRHRSRSRH
ncbi:hypothetical protein [Methylobacterium nodulans]|uniref:Uncharacterized protein n=1 Tax=Methylobacterium nodulans (strain LMG 21967 / CNCM I-2342 / ORS 2060) TaxID=460265 RepID=B8IQN5_METNO|nr:hypothetical protein [Methylobacterium nodulans]ACL60547.1 hypothetical protein Mnod_5717 [Methylobacterium nodulans ORS 2060]